MARAGFRYDTPAPAAPAPVVYQGMPGTSGPMRVAGEAIEQPGVWSRISDAFTGGKQQVASSAKGAANGLKGANAKIIPGLLKNGVRVAGAGGVLTVLGAAGELADEDDPFARNLAQAGGNAAGGLAGVATGATLGTMILPGIGTVIGGGLGGFFGSGAGADLAGGIYDAVTGESPEERARQKLIKDANVQDQIARQRGATQNQLMVDQLQAQMPLMKDAMAIRRQDDMLRAERELRVQNDYNYSNALNQAMLQAQNNAQLQNLAMTQFMMG